MFFASFPGSCISKCSQSLLLEHCISGYRSYTSEVKQHIVELCNIQMSLLLFNSPTCSWTISEFSSAYMKV